jgi:hypothetical protein
MISADLSSVEKICGRYRRFKGKGACELLFEFAGSQKNHMDFTGRIGISKIASHIVEIYPSLYLE